MKTLFATMRLPFLVLTPVSILLGISLSAVSFSWIVAVDIMLVMLGGVLAHISVNMLNEYHDFRSGLDERTSRTPFSGGSGGLPENPAVLKQVFWIAVASLMLTVFIGGYFIWKQGWLILPLGILGVAIVLAYTPWLNRHPFLCLLAPGLGFGPVMVLGTSIVLGSSFTMEALVVSLVPFFLASNLLLLNQLPDLEADASVGRRHFPITYGFQSSIRVYALFAGFTGLTILASVFMIGLPMTVLFSLLPMLLLLPVVSTFIGVSEFSNTQVRLLGFNVIATILTPLVLSLALLTQ